MDYCRNDPNNILVLVDDDKLLVLGVSTDWVVTCKGADSFDSKPARLQLLLASPL